jgi:hypothetical protein
MRETAGGRTPVGAAKRKPTLPPVLTGAALDAARAENARVTFRVLFAMGVFVAVAVPMSFLPRPVGPVTEVEGRGYFVSYVAPLGTKHFRADIYIGLGSDGKCYVANQPAAWDTGLCAVRLRQIETMDCKVLPDFNDEHCRALPLHAGIEGQRRPVRMVFLVADGRASDARELP